MHSPARSAIRGRRSTISSSSTSCSARPCPTSRSMPSPISAMRTAAFSSRYFPARHCSATSRGDRAQGEFEPQDRRRLCALDRLRRGRRAGARLCALGDGAKRDEAAPAPAAHVPALPKAVAVADSARPVRRCGAVPMTTRLPAASARFADYAPGERIDHVDGMTVEEAEHQLATRLYQNTARIHFNQFAEGQGPVRPPPHLWRPRDFAGPCAVASTASPMPSISPAINGGRHVAPLFAGDTVFAWSEVIEQQELPGRERCRRAAAAPRRHQESAMRRFPGPRRRGLRCGRDPGPGLLGSDPALNRTSPDAIGAAVRLQCGHVPIPAHLPAAAAAASRRRAAGAARRLPALQPVRALTICQPSDRAHAAGFAARRCGRSKVCAAWRQAMAAAPLRLSSASALKEADRDPE